MYLKFVLLGIFESGHDKKQDLKSLKTATELLTGSNWKLVNKEQGDDKILETGENGFYKNGNNTLHEVRLSETILLRRQETPGVRTEYLFTWQFGQGEKVMDYLFGAVNILKLDEEELILYNDEMDDNGQTRGFINTYRH